MLRLSVCLALLAGVCALRARPIVAGQVHAPKDPKPEAKAATNLAREIHHQLLLLPYYSVFDSISFALNGNKVTLTGQVVRPTLRANAEAAIKTIEGVETVVNQIEVLPASPSDDELRRAVYRAIFEDPTLAAYAVQAVPPIHIVVKNGNVSLEGWVNSAADKNLAGSRANAVAEALSVKNNLVVQPKAGAAE